jgi:nucleoside-diphosphate-sugar epimerase
MRILILGGTGLTGPHVARQLVAAGHEVTVAHTGAHEADLPPAVAHLHHPALTRVERRYPDDLVATLRRQAPDVVLDAAPMLERDATTTVQVFRGYAGRLVALSSMDVYRAYGILLGKEPGPPQATPLTEDAALRTALFPYRQAAPRPPDDPARWMDEYDKIPVERVVLGQPDLPGTVLRLPAVYGPGDGQHRLFPYLKRMDDGRPAILLAAEQARWRWTRGSVGEVARAIALAVADGRAAGRVYNVGEAEALSEEEWVRAIGRAAGWGGRVLALPRAALPAHLQPTIAYQQSLVADTGRIRRELGYTEAVTRDAALRQAVAWERAQPPEQLDRVQFDYAAEDAALAAWERASAAP